MKRFSFRLEKVLRYRKYLEKKAQKRLGDTIHEYQSRENAIKDIENKQTELSAKCSEEKSKGISTFRFQCYNHYFNKLSDDQKSESLALKETQEKVQLHRSLLKKELIRRKMLEKLKDIQSVRYKGYAEKDEQKLSDETVIIRSKRLTA
ncbi:MAG: flagellar export protein FliJ [Desulfobacterales bacterium]